MQVLQLLQKNNIDLNLGKELGSGLADGQVFQLDNDRVIKLSILYEIEDINLQYERIEEVLQYLIDFVPSAYARVHSYKKIFSGKKEEQRFIIYQYVMDRYVKITDDEEKVFHTILSHEDRNLKKNYSIKEIENICSMLNIGLEFDIDRALYFCNSIIENKIIQHNDIHQRNIMKDNNGNFVLIDFDRAKLI